MLRQDVLGEGSTAVLGFEIGLLELENIDVVEMDGGDMSNRILLQFMPGGHS